jgi:hypothetical protein
MEIVFFTILIAIILITFLFSIVETFLSTLLTVFKTIKTIIIYSLIILSMIIAMYYFYDKVVKNFESAKDLEEIPKYIIKFIYSGWNI